jgi:hypothetical protein
MMIAMTFNNENKRVFRKDLRTKQKKTYVMCVPRD